MVGHTHGGDGRLLVDGAGGVLGVNPPSNIAQHHQLARKHRPCVGEASPNPDVATITA